MTRHSPSCVVFVVGRCRLARVPKNLERGEEGERERGRERENAPSC